MQRAEFNSLANQSCLIHEIALDIGILSIDAIYHRCNLTQNATYDNRLNMLLQTSSDYLQLAQQQEPKWKKMLQHERDQKVRIEKMVEQLARQHSHLEEAAQHAIPSATPAGGHRPSRKLIDFYSFLFRFVNNVSMHLSAHF